jgi:hypothetical protein
MVIRWAEDWTAARAAGKAPAYKALPLGGPASLTLSGEVRLRADAHDSTQLRFGERYEQGLLRAVGGVDLRLNPSFRLYAEAGTAQVRGRKAAAAANQQNALSLQQGMFELRQNVGDAKLGMIVGRHLFSDGPRQLISIGDGANLQRSWNGVRAYAFGGPWRIGAFDLRATRLGRGGMDEGVNAAETLRGVTGAYALGADSNRVYLAPFLYRTDQPAARLAGRVGRDRRDTLGARVWGQYGDARYDWTLAYQDGMAQGREASAWGVFGSHSYGLSNSGWRPRLTLRVDAASGGNYARGVTRTFNPLYSSSNYIAEGQFLGLSNLLMLTPGITVTPMPRTSLSFDVGFARRLDGSDAVYGAALRPYAGTQLLTGKDVGRISRLIGNWSPVQNVTLFLNAEHMHAGTLLQRSRAQSGYYVYTGVTFRY